jgi:hypothetical protein
MSYCSEILLPETLLFYAILLFELGPFALLAPFDILLAEWPLVLELLQLFKF